MKRTSHNFKRYHFSGLLTRYNLYETKSRIYFNSGRYHRLVLRVLFTDVDFVFVISIHLIFRSICGKRTKYYMLYINIYVNYWGDICYNEHITVRPKRYQDTVVQTWKHG